MSRHAKWEADEMAERILTETGSGIAELDELLALNKAALADLDRLISA